MFKAVENEKSKFLFDAVDDDEIFFLAWTTTPWTFLQIWINCWA